MEFSAAHRDAAYFTAGRQSLLKIAMLWKFSRAAVHNAQCPATATAALVPALVSGCLGVFLFWWEAGVGVGVRASFGEETYAPLKGRFFS